MNLGLSGIASNQRMNPMCIMECTHWSGVTEHRGTMALGCVYLEEEIERAGLDLQEPLCGIILL